jgi:hypothetical protein
VVKYAGWRYGKKTERSEGDVDAFCFIRKRWFNTPAAAVTTVTLLSFWISVGIKPTHKIHTLQNLHTAELALRLLIEQKGRFVVLLLV